MTGRKGEPPAAQPLNRWSVNHPVARSIPTGDKWFRAWLMQKAMAFARLTKLTGIPTNRLFTLSQGGQVSRAEADALARAWSISSADPIAWMPDPTLVVD